ncbi:MAG: DctP family TRAP transporter solute-binding subunit [Deltaproteobacteria bacterium]
MKRGMHILLVVAAVSLSLAMLLPAPATAAYKSEYKLSVVVGPKFPWGEGATKFADLVRERTKGRIHIKVYTSSSLMAGKQTNEFLILKQGVADFAFASTINWSSTINELNLFNLPFLFPDYKALDAVKEGSVGKKIAALLEEKGVLFLGWGENGFREITNSKRAIHTPDDMAGLKIRVVGTPAFIDTMKALGANPVNMNWGEAQVAFQQGVVDGQENPVVGVLIPVKIWQFHKHITLWHYVIDPLMLTVNKEVFESFTPEDRKIIREAAAEATKWQVETVRKGLIPPDLSALEFLRKQGMEVSTLSKKERQLFIDKTRGVYEEWKGKIGKNLVEEAEKIIAAH